MTSTHSPSLRSPRPETRHVSVWIDADWASVYAFAADPENLPKWAAGLADPALDLEILHFAPTNDFGVLDHLVRLPDGRQIFNPMRVIPTGPGESGCDVVFTLRRRADQSDADFDQDAAAVTADLSELKRLTQG